LEGIQLTGTPEVDADFEVLTAVRLPLNTTELHTRITAKVTGRSSVGKGIDQGAVPLLQAEAVYDLKYAVREGGAFTKDVALDFADKNAVHNAWPFLREALYSATHRLGVVPVTLPLMRI